MRTEWTLPPATAPPGTLAANPPSLSIQRRPLQKALMLNPKHFSALFYGHIANSPKATVMLFSVSAVLMLLFFPCMPLLREEPDADQRSRPDTVIITSRHADVKKFLKNLHQRRVQSQPSNRN